ncbi:MAG: thiamine pyrophosphate-dependent enzyme [bacterium]
MTSDIEGKTMSSTKSQGKCEQTIYLESGNEMAALAIKQVNPHVMGYYPITPSTQIAETLDAFKAAGDHDVVMIPGDGEHGAAGICYGASVAAARVANATSANGLLFALEQLPVQSGTRYPMVLNLVNRTVSGPLSIKCDHSDLMFTLNTGWLILIAEGPQEVYDFNIMAFKIGELEDVRLPVIVSSDGFFTSHQKRRVYYLTNSEDVRNWIGPMKTPIHALDPEHPATIGPYMNEPDLINNKKQLSMAMDNAYHHVPGVFAEWGEMTGRNYSMIKTYPEDFSDVEAAVWVMGSPSETMRFVAKQAREKGKKVGVIVPKVLRPWPINEIREITKNLKSLVITDRQDSFNFMGGNMTTEVKSAIFENENRPLVQTRVYGIGGKDLSLEDCRELIELSLEATCKKTISVPYEYLGAEPGDPEFKFESELKPLKEEDLKPGIFRIEATESGTVDVKGVNLRKLTRMPNRILPGHGACPGCGIFSTVNQFLKGIEGHVVVLFATGCGMVVTTGYPSSSHRSTYIHNLFQSGAATLSGVVEAYHEKQRRGELDPNLDLTFIMVAGDGSNDIGQGPTIGAAIRNHNMIVLEYDNEGYMNTGNQLSFAVPKGFSSSTSHVGPAQVGKQFGHKDNAQIYSACNIPYVFTATEANSIDLIKKAAKAQWYAKNKGFVFGKLFSSCPLNWRVGFDTAKDLMQKAVDCNFFPLYEVENGITKINYDPEKRNKKIPVSDWVGSMGRSRHLTKPENAELLKELETEVERRWQRLKARDENPIL